MANNIYKAGIPSVVGTKTAGSLNVNSTPTVVGNPSPTVFTVASPVVGAANYHGGQNGYNGSATYGVKMAGSLNANGVLTVAPGKNSPQS
jgi:hypothetical protein